MLVFNSESSQRHGGVQHCVSKIAFDFGQSRLSQDKQVFDLSLLYLGHNMATFISTQSLLFQGPIAKVYTE